MPMYYQKGPDPIGDFFSRLIATTLGVFLGGMLAWWAVTTITKAELRAALKEAQRATQR
jgi:uncharacterized membrane protein YccC